MKKLFKQFSFPGGIPSHVAPETPGSIHEGGELGYALSHAFGAAFDNPDLLVACVVGDGEAETGPLATSWHSNKFLNPVRDGVVLPILHLNGYKIAGPTVLARLPHDELESLFRGYGYKPHFVEGDVPSQVHQLLAAKLDRVIAEIKSIQHNSRTKGFQQRPQWPMIVLRTPKGWTGPKVVDGKQVEGTFRAHQVPMGDMDKPAHIKILERWMKSYQPEELFDQNRQAASGIGGTRAPRHSPHEREPSCQRRAAFARLEDAGLLRLCGERAEARRGRGRSDARPGSVHPRRDEVQSGNFPRVQSGRNLFQPVECLVRAD